MNTISEANEQATDDETLPETEQENANAEEEVVDGSDASVEDSADGEQVEEENPEQATEETEGSEEDVQDEKILITYPDAEGNPTNWEVKVSEIPELVEEVIDSRAYYKNTQQYFEENKNAIIIGNAAQTDPILKQVLLWKAGGHSDKDIIIGLHTAMLNKEGKMADNLIDNAEEVDPALKEAVERVIQPMRQQLESSRNEMLEENMIRKNNEIITSTMYQQGVTNTLTKEETAKFTDTFNELYPKFNTRQEALSPRQIQVVLKESGILNSRQQQQQKPAEKPAVKAPVKTTAQIVRQKKSELPPKVSQGKPATQPTQKTQSQSTTAKAVYDRLKW